MSTPFFQSAEPTRKCNCCGKTKEYKFMVPGRDNNGGVRPLCKECAMIQQRASRERKVARIKEMAKAEVQERKALPNLTPPRTFNYLKSKDTWNGWREPQYIRNDGNKHIPSKGV